MDPLAALMAVAAAQSELGPDAPQEQQQQQQSELPHSAQQPFQPGSLHLPTAASPSMRLTNILNEAPSEQLPALLPAPPHQPPYQYQQQPQYHYEQQPPYRHQFQQQQVAYHHQLVLPAPLAAVESRAPPPQQPQQLRTGNWTEEEKVAAVEGFRTLGTQWALIVQQFVPTRSVTQVRNFVDRWRKKQSSGSQPTRGNSANAAAAASASGAQRVVDLSADEPLPTPQQKQKEEQRRPRRAARSSQSPVAIEDAAPVTPALLLEVIEINTEESAGETPQKAPPPQRSESTARTRFRDQRPPLPSAKSSSTNSSRSQMAPPQRKKAKLTVTIPRRVLEAPPDSPSSSSAISWTSAAKPPRGKKRPPVEFEGIPMPPVTPSFSSPFDERDCEFCRSPFGVCAIMHCSACKRVYHPKCVVNYYKPYCLSEDEPIEKQLEALQLNAPPQVKVNMFRCSSCFAACIESFRSGGFEWDCTCPSCSQPEKLVEYRSRMLFHLMYEGGDLKPVRKQKGSSKHDGEQNGSAATAAKPKESKKTVAAAVPVRTGARRSGRNSASVSETESMEVDSEAPPVEATEPKTNRSSKQIDGSGASAGRSASGCSGDETRGEANGHVHENGDQDDVTGVAGPEREKQALNSRAGDDEEELSGEQILAAVTVGVDEKGFRIFPIVCTETASLTVSGLMKAGQYYTHRSSKKHDFVRCDCCSKDMGREQFVRHTDATFLEMAGKTPSDFLFAAHRDGANHSALDKFLQVLKQHKGSLKPVGHHSKPISAKSRRKNADSRNGSRTSTNEEASSPEEPRVSKEVAIANALQLLKSAMIVRRESNPQATKPGFLVKLVCMSSRLVIRMANGVVQSKLDSSTPGQAYPYKEGWLSFETSSARADSASLTFASVVCSCCLTDKKIEDFITHTGLAAEELKARGDTDFKRHHMFVPQRDSRTMVEFEKVWQAMVVLHTNQQLDAFLGSIFDTVNT